MDIVSFPNSARHRERRLKEYQSANRENPDLVVWAEVSSTQSVRIGHGWRLPLFAPYDNEDKIVVRLHSLPFDKNWDGTIEILQIDKEEKPAPGEPASEVKDKPAPINLMGGISSHTGILKRTIRWTNIFVLQHPRFLISTIFLLGIALGMQLQYSLQIRAIPTVEHFIPDPLVLDNQTRQHRIFSRIK